MGADWSRGRHEADGDGEEEGAGPRGYTNREIADELYLGEATVKTHLGHTFTKLDLRDWSQAVVLAYETGLIQPGDAN